MKRKALKKPFAVEAVGNIAVKIYRRKRPTTTGKSRTLYEVCDYTTGQRRFRSFGDEVEARREAKRIAGLLSTGDATAALMRNSEAASFGRALELLRPTGAALEIAASTYAKAFEILGGDALIEAATFYARHRGDRIKRRKVADAVAELIAAREARGKSPRYIGDLRARLARFAESFAVDISTVTTADVQRWLDGLKLAPQTAKNFRTVLNTLFGFAEARGYILKGANPVEATETIEARGGAIEIFTPQEIAALIEAAPKEFLPIVTIGAFAGLRAAEIERIEWSNIDLAGGFIHIGGDKAKTRSRRLVPILPNLAAWLSPYANQAGQVWKGSDKELREARAATVEAAKTPWKDNGLRHSFISYRLAEIQNAAQVALEAGNSPDVVFKHYRELVRPIDAKRWFAINPETPANVIAVQS